MQHREKTGKREANKGAVNQVSHLYRFSQQNRNYHTEHACYAEQGRHFERRHDHSSYWFPRNFVSPFFAFYFHTTVAACTTKAKALLESRALI
jgi:hypothetical protein